MKKIKLFFHFALILLYLLGFSSCIMAPRGSHGKGHPPGWDKNSNNPHHPNSTNPGHGHNKDK